MRRPVQDIFHHHDRTVLAFHRAITAADAIFRVIFMLLILDAMGHSITGLYTSAAIVAHRFIETGYAVRGGNEVLAQVIMHAQRMTATVAAGTDSGRCCGHHV